MSRAPGSWPTASTHLVGIIGDPIRHSLSPVLHNAAFVALDIDWAYVAFEVAAGGGTAAVDAARALGMEGLSVTMPHKAAAAAAVDELSPMAAALGVINTVVRRGDKLLGDSTDGEGFIDALVADLGFDPAGKRCLILGAGGAARALVVALAHAGATEVVVVGRTAERAEAAAVLAPSVGRAGQPEDASAADLIVNATPLGMLGPDQAAMPLDPTLLGRGQVVADLIYAPAVTPLLEAAREQGATTVNGLGMLVHQAARQFHLWTGNAAPLEAMSAAALGAIAANRP